MEVTQTAPSVNRLLPAVKSVAVVVAAPAPAAPRTRVGLLVALVLLGAGLRAGALASDRNLWIDEAMLALNLVNRTPAQLWDKLDWNQGAPVGFLLAVKGSITAFGAAEWSLRFVPFVLSLAGLGGFAVAARRLLPAGGAPLALGLFAVSPHLINYAAECKQYAGDAAFAVGLLAVSLGLLDGKGGWYRWAGLGLAGAAVVWCSHPSVFILGGIGTALLARAAVARDRARFLSAALTVGAWLASFGVCYVLCLKQLGGNKYLTDYWAGHFMALPPRGLGDLAWLVDHVVAFFATPGGFGGPVVPLGGFAAALALVGLREFARERWTVALAVSVPAGLVLLASGLHKYPVGGRLMLFMVPFAVLLVARGLWAVYEGLAARNRFAAAVLLLAVVGGSGWEAFEMLRRPPRVEQLAPVLEQVRQDFRSGDRAFVYYGATPAFTYYTRGEPFPAEAVTLGDEHRGEPALYQKELNALPAGRVWVIVSHRHNVEEATLLATLDARGTREREVKRTGAAAYLYRLE